MWWEWKYSDSAKKLFCITVLTSKCLIKRPVSNFIPFFLEITHIEFECIACVKDLVGIVS